MRKVLIVSPRFPPKNAADLHRVRTSLPYYRDFGWEPTVLALTPESSDGVDDPMLLESVPADIEVVRAAAWDERRSRRLGVGLVDFRALIPLYRAGAKLLASARYDVVFFSTTVFLSFVLGPVWKRRFGCKIVYDFQDPWYAGDPSPYTRDNAPGGWRKYRLSQSVARRLEPVTLRSADHIISVSEGYVRTLTERYPWLPSSRFSVIPFGAAKEDYRIALRDVSHRELFLSDDRPVRWVSVGRAGPDMNPVLSVFFRQLAVLKQNDPAFASRLRVHFVGTNYAPAERTTKLVEELAQEHGVGDMVREHSVRIPYYQALALYANSDAILLVGSLSADYTASKLFSCVLAGKPVLAMFHCRSLVTRTARGIANVFVASFDTPSESEFASAVAEGIQWVQQPTFDASVIEAQVADWSARNLTRAQCAIFDACIGQHSTRDMK